MAAKLIHHFGAFVGARENDISGKLLSLGLCGDWTFEAPLADETEIAAEIRIREKRFSTSERNGTCPRCEKHRLANTCAASVANARAERVKALAAIMPEAATDETGDVEAAPIVGADMDSETDETGGDESDYGDLLDHP